MLLLAVALTSIVGCSTKSDSVSSPRIGSGAQEYQHLTEESLAAIQKMQVWLDRLGAQTNGCSPKLVASFSRELERLQVDSIKVRSRAQAIQARGNAYFEAWSENPSSAGKIAGYLPQLEEAFGKVKLATQQAGGVFRPFLSGLRKIRVRLERAPGALQTEDGKELMRSTHELGAQVGQRLGVLRDELKAIIPVLARAKAAESL